MNDLRVKDLMTRGVFALLPDDDLSVLTAMMDGWAVRHAPVVDEGNLLLGLVSQRDLLANTLYGGSDVDADQLVEDLQNHRAQDVMSTLVETIEPDADLVEAARRMFDGKLGCLVVVDGRHHLQGILTESDFVRFFAEQRHLAGAI